jgi:hypothetical protein
VSSSSNIVEAVTKLQGAYRRWQHPSQILIEPLVAYQTVFEIGPPPHATRERPTYIPGLNVRWVAYYSITNLTDQPVAIKDFDVEFHGDARLRLHRRHSFLQAYVSDTETPFREETDLESFLTVGPPMLVAAGAKRYYGFMFDFDLYADGRKVTSADEQSIRNQVQLAVGGYIDDGGQCRGVGGPVTTIMTLSDGRELRSSANTFLAVEGCVIALQ